MRLNRNGWQDPSEVLVIDQKQYTISELDRKSWAEVFAPPAQRAAPDNIRTVNDAKAHDTEKVRRARWRT